jgi:hypothetical protein
MKKAMPPSILIAVMLLAVAAIAEAQQTRSVTRIGYLSSVNPANESARAEGIRRSGLYVRLLTGAALIVTADKLKMVSSRLS